MRELWLKIAHAGGARSYGLLISFITLIITARWLGPQGRGVLAAVITWVTLFATFGSLSLGQVAIHRAAERRGEPWLGETLAMLLVITAVVTAAGWLIAAVLYVATRGAMFHGIAPAILIAGFMMLPFLLWEQYGSSLLTAIDRLDIYNNWQIVGRTAGVVLLLIMAASRWGVLGAVVALVVAQAVTGVAGLPHLLRAAGGFVPLRIGAIGELLRGGAKLHLNAIGMYLVMSTDVLIINYYRGAAETGYYQLAVQLVNTLLIIPQAAAMVLYGRVAQLGPDAAWAYNRRALGGVTLLVVILAAIAAFAGPLLIPLIAGHSFDPAIAPFRWLLAAVVGMTFATMMAPQWIGRGMFLQASLITALLGAMNLVISLAWVPRYGMYGSVAGTVITYVVAVIVNSVMAVVCERSARRAGLSAPGGTSTPEAQDAP
jgi:O-antigen/teichoic acid export membrane protein